MSGSNEKKTPIIETIGLSKDYGGGRGDFDISFRLEAGKTLGLVGENGAGKTTLLRLLMGFIKPTGGQAYIAGHDCLLEAPEIKRFVSYIPGEINFPDLPTGRDFLKQYAKENAIPEERIGEMGAIIQALQLDISAYPRRMSKGMKQKTSIVAAFMKDGELLIMDEPTTGLDPLMRDTFLSLILEEKKRGKSVLMSSNTIEELEKVSDYVALISKGHLIDIADCAAIKNRDERDYKVEFMSENDYLWAKERYRQKVIRDQGQYHQLTLRIDKGEIVPFLRALSDKPLRYLSEVPYNLTAYFAEWREGKVRKELTK